MTELKLMFESLQNNLVSTIKSEVSKLSKGMEAITDIKENISILQSDILHIKQSIESLKTTTNNTKHNGFESNGLEKGALSNGECNFIANGKADLHNLHFKQITSGSSDPPIVQHGADKNDRRCSAEFESGDFCLNVLKQLNAPENETFRRSLELVSDDHDSARHARLVALRRRFEQEQEGVISLSSLLSKLRKGELGSMGRDFARTVFGIRPRNTALGIEGSRLIVPTSPFHASFEIVSAGMLVYSAFMVPIQLTFWNVDDPCWVYPTLYFDMFVDVFFLFETFYSLFVGVLDSKGNYEDSLSQVLIINLTSPDRFWFNLCTSAPVSWLDWYVIQLCGRNTSASFGFNAALLRVAKPLRLVKLMRLLKSSKAYVMMLDALDINPIVPRIFKIFCVLAVAMHICSCLFWVVKTSGSEEALHDWLADRGLERSDKAGCYLVCIYCISTVFTTVGFGDIYATSGAERVFFIFLELTAACLFGTLLGELQEVFASINKNSRLLETHMEGVISFLNMNRMPTALKTKVKSYVRFKFIHDESDKKVQHILDIIPLSLRDEIATTLNTGIFSKVRLFRRIEDATDRDQFVSALLKFLHTETCSRGSIVARSRELADRIVIIGAGRVSMVLPTPGKRQASRSTTRPPIPSSRTLSFSQRHNLGSSDGSRTSRQRSYAVGTGDPNDGKHLLVLKTGDSFGDASVIGDPRWASAWGIDADFHAMEDSHITYIKSSDILNLLERQPRFSHIRRRFLTLAETLKTNREENASEESMQETEARATFRWSLYVQLLVRSRMNDFSDIASTMGRAGGNSIHQPSNSTSHLLDRRSWSLMRRQERSSRPGSPSAISPTAAAKLPRRRSHEESASAADSPATPQGPGRHRLSSAYNLPQRNHNGIHEVSAHAEIGMLDSSSGVFHNLGSPGSPGT